MKTAYSQGLTIDHTPTAERLSGAGTLIGVVGNGMIGVAISDVAANTAGVFAVEGVHTLPKLGTDVVGQGALLYWDNTNLRLTLTSASNTVAGRAFAAAGNGVTTVACKINVT